MKSFIELEKERSEWSNKIFTEATPLSSLRKAQEEIHEIRVDLHEGEPKAEEYADAIMCLFDSAQRAGLTANDIRDAYEKKNHINIYERTWKKNPDNTYSHIKQ